MKIDAVIGNPPYNNDMYIPFVEMGHQLSTDCSLFITPAKWQAKGGEKNEAFRQNIVPHMSKIVYYPDETDIFDIVSYGGITYYLIDKHNVYKQKQIENISSRVNGFNNITERELCWILNNIGSSVVSKINDSRLYIDRFSQDKMYKVALSKLLLWSGHSKYLYTTDGHTSVLSIPEIIEGEYEDNKRIAYSSDNKAEAESFSSFVKTKFIRFLILVGSFTQSTAVSNETWRFVPDPGTFDHIFTDEELYKKYNLTEEEINIIESVIKERK